MTGFTVDTDDEVTAASSTSGGLNNRRSADKTPARHTVQPHLAAKNERSIEMHDKIRPHYDNRPVGEYKRADRQNPTPFQDLRIPPAVSGAALKD